MVLKKEGQEGAGVSRQGEDLSSCREVEEDKFPQAE